MPDNKYPHDSPLLGAARLMQRSRDLSLDALAEKVGMSTPTVWRKLKGKSPIKEGELDKIARALDTTVEHLQHLADLDLHRLDEPGYEPTLSWKEIVELTGGTWH